MRRFTVLAVVVVAALCGCGTSPPVRYYALSEPAVSTVAKTSDRVVEVGPFSLPEFLDRPQIVVRDAGHGLHFSEFDRWAESPQRAVVRWLARDVDRQLTSAVVVAFPAASRGSVGYRVRGSIGRWDVDATGGAVLVVQWECVADDGSVVLPLRTADYTADSGNPDDYGAVVSALNRTLADFARDIATALGALSP